MGDVKVRPKLLFTILGALVVAAAGAEIYSTTYMSRPADPFRVEIGGAFTMVNQDNQVVTDKDFLGKPLVIFFGFTYCPDICPTTLNRLTVLLEKLGPDRENIRIALVTVDPERDTPEALKQYLEAFDPRVVGLTGSPTQLASFAKKYKAYYNKVPGEYGDYTIDHTSSILLFDQHGGFVDTLNKDDDLIALSQLRKLIKK